LAINIDISNYEEYLLSAVDNELNEEEQAALEIFLEHHPMYRQELILLQSARFVPDEHLHFDMKEHLYRNTSSLSAGNYESYLLEYVDNELSTEMRLQVEELAQEYPHISRDLRFLQASRMEADLAVKFPDKASLYRHRTTVRPIWWWAAAAAIVAGVVVFTIPANRDQRQGAQLAIQQPIRQVVRPQTVTADNNNGNKPADTYTAPDQASVAVNQSAPSNAVPKARVIPATSVNAVTPASHQPTPVSNQEEHPASVALSKLPQPESTSSEIVQQLKEQKEQIANAAISNELDKAPVVAKSDSRKEDAMNTRVTESSRPEPGELVVSVTMRGDSKVLNGVANVARFFSKKKK
jgi:hypothetical protein